MVKIMPQSGDVIVSATLVDTYAALNIIGIILLVFLTLTILLSPRSKLHRDPTLINAFIVLIWVNLWNIMYWMAVGGDIGIWESFSRPKLGVCKAQAAVLAGSQPAQAAAVFALCLRLWITTMELSVTWFRKLRSTWFLVILLALPHLTYIAFIPVLVSLIEEQKSHEISPTPFYCSTLNDETRWGYQSLALAFSALSLAMEIHLIYLVSRQFRNTSQAAVRASGTLSHSMGINAHIAPERSIKRAFFFRVGVFISWTLIMLAATLYQAFTKTELDPDADLLFACVSPLAFICFATQPDVLRAWYIPATKEEWSRFWKRESNTARRASGETIKLTGDLGWAEFLGSTSPDTIYSIDSRLSGMEEKARIARGVHRGMEVNIPEWRIQNELERVSEERESRSASLVVSLSKAGRRPSERSADDKGGPSLYSHT